MKESFSAWTEMDGHTLPLILTVTLTLPDQLLLSASMEFRPHLLLDYLCRIVDKSAYGKKRCLSWLHYHRNMARQDQKASELMDSDNLPSCVQEVQKCPDMQFVRHPDILHSRLNASSTPAIAGTASQSQLVYTSSVRAEFMTLFVHKQPKV